MMSFATTKKLRLLLCVLATSELVGEEVEEVMRGPLDSTELVPSLRRD